jgi:hypothetical protein
LVLSGNCKGKVETLYCCNRRSLLENQCSNY